MLPPVRTPSGAARGGIQNITFAIRDRVAIGIHLHPGINAAGAVGAAITWTNGVGDGLWGTAGNWDGGVPVGSTNIVFPWY